MYNIGVHVQFYLINSSLKWSRKIKEIKNISYLVVNSESNFIQCGQFPLVDFGWVQMECDTINKYT